MWRWSRRTIGVGDCPSVPAEYHSTCARLQHACYNCHHLLADMVSATFDDDHRAIFEIADPLARFLAGLYDPDLDLLARQKHRLERIRDVVQIDDADVMQLGH